MESLVTALLMQVVFGVYVVSKMRNFAKRSFLDYEIRKRSKTQKFFTIFLGILFTFSVVAVFAIVGLYFEGRFKIIIGNTLILGQDYYGNKMYYDGYNWQQGEPDINLLAATMFFKYLLSVLYLLFIFLSLAVYSYCFKRSGSTVWAKCRKIIGYFLLLIVVLSIPSVLVVDGGKDNILIYLIILIVVLLTFLCTKEYKSDRCKEKIKKNAENHSKPKVVKVLALILTPLILIILSLDFGVKSDNDIAMYYILLFLLILIYYLVLIIKRKSLGGENIMFLPILVKMKIFDDIESVRVCRKKLIMNIMPLMLIHIVVIIVLALSDHRGYYDMVHNRRIGNDSSLMFISLIPIMLTIVFFIKEYSVKWINAAKDEK